MFPRGCLIRKNFGNVGSMRVHFDLQPVQSMARKRLDEHLSADVVDAGNQPYRVETALGPALRDHRGQNFLGEVVAKTGPVNVVNHECNGPRGFLHYPGNSLAYRDSLLHGVEISLARERGFYALRCVVASFESAVFLVVHVIEVFLSDRGCSTPKPSINQQLKDSIDRQAAIESIYFYDISVDVVVRKAFQKILFRAGTVQKQRVIGRDQELPVVKGGIHDVLLSERGYLVEWMTLSTVTVRFHSCKEVDD
mmetsp:Transcript_9981/g.21470  ORF Transcript_9981/g.21470 Transcript_9981/m.21470 type:complete len:252 (+) Transcript_9981:483-1238(+)